MTKLALKDRNGNVLGIGYMGNSAEDRNALEELRRQIQDSRIEATLETEEVEGMDMGELGRRMRDYQAIVNTSRMVEMLYDDGGRDENDENEGYPTDLVYALLNRR